MTQDDVIRLAQEAGACRRDIGGAIEFLEDFMLERFAKLVAEHEREACADLCETWFDPMWNEHNQAAQELAKAIRARGQA